MLVVGIHVEGALEAAHAVFEEHGVELLLDGILHLIEAQQVGHGRAVLGPFQDAVVVEALDDIDGLGDELVGFLDDGVGGLEVLLGESAAVALGAHADHAIAFRLPLLGAEAREFTNLDKVEAGRGLAVGGEHAQSDQDLLPVPEPLGILFRQAQGEESPGGAHAMIAIGHVAGGADGRPRPVRRGVVRILEPVGQVQVPIPVGAFNGIDRAVLRGRVHFPLRMVKAHVTGHAGFGAPSFCGGEAVTRVAGIAFTFVQPDAMAASAPLHAFNEGVGLHGRGGHGNHSPPGDGMLARGELLKLLGMTRRAIAGRNPAPHALVFTGRGGVKNARGRLLNGKVAGRASHAHFKVLAELPVADGAARDALLHVTLQAGAAILGNSVETQLAGSR